MQLKIGGIYWEPDEILFLAQAALNIAPVPPKGDGSHLNPLQMSSVEQWYSASVDPPKDLKRVFYVVGGRLLHRRLNRTQPKYSDYITECGPWNEKTKQAIDDAKKSGKFKTHIDPTPDQYQTERFDKPPRWYTRAGSGVPDDSDLKDLGGIGPTYNSLEDAISLLLQGETNDVRLAKMIRGCLAGQENGAPASVACMTAAWFLAEVKRHPRSMLSALILLDMIEGKHSADSQALFHADTLTFKKVVSRQSELPHPMSGKGTVDKAKSAQNRTKDLTDAIDKSFDDKSQTYAPVTHKRGGKGLNNVEARESEIIIRWLARRLHESGIHEANFSNEPDTRERVKIVMEGEKLHLRGLITGELWKRLSSFDPMI